MGSPAYNMRVRASERAAVFYFYGLVCACCGLSGTESHKNWCLLTIDHLDGNGEMHRTAVMPSSNGWRPSGGAKFYRWLIKNGFPAGYQTLCAPCNLSKGDGDTCQIAH